MPKPCSNAALLLLSTAFVAACVDSGDYPSLAPRPIERNQRAAEPTQPQPPRPADKALAARIDQLLAQARDGQAAFDKELGRAASKVVRSGAFGSESWIAAQEAVSRLEGARAPTTNALSELDALERAQGTSGGQETDRSAIAAAQARIDQIAQAQQAEINRLASRMPSK